MNRMQGVDACDGDPRHQSATRRVKVKFYADAMMERVAHRNRNDVRSVRGVQGAIN